MSELWTKEVEDLLRVLVGFDDHDTAYRFFEDVMTVREIREISQRLQVARLLDEGKPDSVIEKQTGASATTIARVSKALNYGSGGYRAALEILDSAD